MMSLEDLHKATTQQLVEDYANETTVFTGSYLTEVRKRYEKQTDDSDTYNPNRLMVSLSVIFYHLDDPAEKKGTAFIQTSPEGRRTPFGTLDTPCKLYMQLARAIGANPAEPIEVYDKAERVMFVTKVQEQYGVEEEDLHPSHTDAKISENTGKAYVTLAPDDVEEREHYFSLGIDARVQVKAISAVKLPKGAVTPSKNGSKPKKDTDIPF